MEPKVKTLTNIFLNKNWIITETPNAIEIISPEQYFCKNDENTNIGIWFYKSVVFNSIKFQNQMVIGIDFEKEYEIVTTYRDQALDNKKIIKGKELFDQFQIAKQKIKDKYFNNQKKIINPETNSDNEKWLK